MNIIRTILSFLQCGPESLRLGPVSERIARADELRYLTVADSKRAMRADRARLTADLRHTLNTYGKESRTE